MSARKFLIALFFVLSQVSCSGTQSNSSGGPTATDFFPEDGATNVVRNTIVIATFDHDLDEITVTKASVYAEVESNAIDATVSYDSAEKQITLTPTSAFPANKQVDVHITTAIQDTDHIQLSDEVVWSFTTSAEIDSTLPTFSGIVSASNNGDGTADLSWSAASDNLTPTNKIRYLIYISSNLTQTIGTAIGTTTFTTPYTAPAAYTWTVRAQDSAGNTDTNVATASATITAPSPSFAAAVQPIFTSNCTFSSCHDASDPQKGQNLTAGSAYANIVGVASQERSSLSRVEPGDPLQSYLYLKITGSSITGSRMPKGASALSGSTIATIRNWILNGALNN